MEVLVVFVVMMALALPIACVPQFLYHRARRKGYRAPGAILVTLVPLALAVSITAATLPSSSSGLGVFQVIALIGVIPVTVWWITGYVLLALLPRRSARVYGDRHIALPLTILGWTIGAVGSFFAVQVSYSWFAGAPSNARAERGAANLAWLLIPLGYYVVGRGRELARQLPLAQTLRDDPRTPVLYLRAFDHEVLPFAAGDAGKYGTLAEGWRRMPMSGRVEIPFEQYFHQEIEKRLGPFVALGSPEDYLPPQGALREYATDDTWQQEFARLAHQARCIVAEVGSSDNLRWELTHLRANNLQRKLFFFSPSGQVAEMRRSRAAPFFQWMVGLRPLVNWQTFSTELGRVGYEVSLDDPGPGSLFTFDAKARQVLLTTEADFPDEFMAPLEAWLTRRAKTGRCIPSSCKQCGRTVYVLRRNDPLPPFCSRCLSPHRTPKRFATLFLAISCGIIGAFGYDGSFDVFFEDHLPFGDHPRILTTVVLAVLLVIASFTSELE